MWPNPVVTCCADVSIKMLIPVCCMDLARALRLLGLETLPDAECIERAWALTLAKEGPEARMHLNEAKGVLLKFEAAWLVKQQELKDRVEFVRVLPYDKMPPMDYASALRQIGGVFPDAEAVECAWRSCVEGMIPAKNVPDPFSRERKLNQARDVLLAGMGSLEHSEAMRMEAERLEAARLKRLEAEERENLRREQERHDLERIEMERQVEREARKSVKRKAPEPITYRENAMKILGLSGDAVDVQAVEKAWEFQVENTRLPRKSSDPYAKTRMLTKAKDVLLGSMGSEAQQKAAEELATELLGSEEKKKKRKLKSIKIHMRITEFAGTVEEFNERRVALAQWANSVSALFERRCCHVTMKMS